MSMQIVPGASADLIALAPAMTAWRRDFHAHPELSGQETRTARIVFDVLTEMGLPPEGGIGGAGVVAVIEGAAPGPSIGLREGIWTPLPLQDESGAPHASRTPGVSHACGHDGHTATLLGLARRSSATRPARPVGADFPARRGDRAWAPRP